MNETIPQGFEAYFSSKKISAQRENLKVLCYSLKQLEGRDLSDLELLRARALKNYEEKHQIKLPASSLSLELSSLPPGLTPADKLLMKAYDEQDDLVAYAQVICSWPEEKTWTIDQLLLDPDKAHQGLGSKLINIIENLARTAEVGVTSIISTPSRPKSESFWKAIGYKELDKDQAQKVPLSTAERSEPAVLSLRKEL